MVTLFVLWIPMSSYLLFVVAVASQVDLHRRPSG